MKVSVIIPVLNLEKIIGRAIDSVLGQPEVEECIVIDDGSTDKTKVICEKYASQDSRVKVLCHPKNANLGVSASRNLGLKTATCDYVSFLDGDDYFLENRFAQAKAAFQANPLIDGVYEAMVAETDLAEPSPELTSMQLEVVPDELFFKMAPFGNSGHFSICALTLKRYTALAINPFHESLTLTEDTLWIAQLSINFILIPGNLRKPVVVRGLHPNNNSKNLALLRGQRVKMCFYLLDWANQDGQSAEVKSIIVKLLLKYHFEHNQLLSTKSKWSRKWGDLDFLLRLYRIDSTSFQNERVIYFRNLVFGLANGKHLDFYE